MTTMLEVIDAAKRLSLPEQREVIREIQAVMDRKGSIESKPQSPLGLPPDFSDRLQHLFYRAKLEALKEEPRP